MFNEDAQKYEADDNGSKPYECDRKSFMSWFKNWAKNFEADWRRNLIRT